MTLNQIKELLDTTGFPVAYRFFPENEAPVLPFICYLVVGSDNFAADGGVYHNINRIDVELYSKDKDVVAEQKIETALSGIFWNKSEQYLEDEDCYEVIYELEV